MESWVLQNESTLRLTTFVVVFFAIAIWEWVSPKRKRLTTLATRWVNNLSLMLINTLLIRLFFPMAAVGIALIIKEQQIGLLNLIEIPPVAAVTLSVILLDCAIYWQHRFMHKIPLLWRMHRVHHADPEFDVTTGLRFHPFEIAISMIYKTLIIALLGAPVLAVLIFELLLNAGSLFNHGNINLTAKIDTALRRFIVTPDMHRIHHSTDAIESNRNFGFALSWWDHLFGSYQSKPSVAHEEMPIGLDEYRDPKHAVFLTGVLSIPFINAHKKTRD
jgi:sterol desaturase/sphingolipid hydroxylase (fatty acid hydroxylase superfamily)